MKISVAEYKNDHELPGSLQTKDLDDLPLSIGLHPRCGLVVGKALGKDEGWGGVSGYHATIYEAEGGAIILKDGNGKPSTNGIYSGSEKVQTVILVHSNGIQNRNRITLSRRGTAKIELWVVVDESDGSDPRITSTGNDLIAELQTQVELMSAQIEKSNAILQAFGAQVLELQAQLKGRIELDSHQTLLQDEQEKQIAETRAILTKQLDEQSNLIQLQAKNILRLRKDDRRIIVLALLALAIAFFSSGVFDALDQEKKKSVVDWIATIAAPLVFAWFSWQIHQRGEKDGNP